MKRRDVILRVHPLTPLMAALAVYLGEGERLAAVSVSLLLHEMGHLAAARIVKAEVAKITLSPLGGAIHLSGAWQLRPLQACAVAAAGPAVNLLLACAATLTKNPLWLNANLALMLFNLIPALPMDGGRILSALLARRMRLTRAVRWAVISGRICAALLFIAFAAGAAGGRVNITLLFAPVYILISAKGESSSCGGAALLSLAQRRREMEREGALPVRLLAMPLSATALDAAARLTPRTLHLILSVDDTMRVVRLTGEGELLRLAMTDGSMKLCADKKSPGTSAGGEWDHFTSLSF